MDENKTNKFGRLFHRPVFRGRFPGAEMFHRRPDGRGNVGPGARRRAPSGPRGNIFGAEKGAGPAREITGPQ